jgi:hypothetical protein
LDCPYRVLFLGSNYKSTRAIYFADLFRRFRATAQTIVRTRLLGTISAMKARTAEVCAPLLQQPSTST